MSHDGTSGVRAQFEAKYARAEPSIDTPGHVASCGWNSCNEVE